MAISAALLTGAGFPALEAACLALIANTAPVAFGALGTPIITLAKVTGLDEFAISQMAGRQLPFFSLIVPAWMVATMTGWQGLLAVWPAVHRLWRLVRRGAVGHGQLRRSGTGRRGGGDLSAS